MANLNDSPLGNARGSIGPFVFKKRYGRIYVARKPEKFTVPQDEGSKFRRGKFRICTKLFSALGKNFWVKYFWKQTDIPGDTWMHKMYHVNYDRITDDLDFRDIIMVPSEEGFKAETESVTFENGVLTVKVKPFPEDSVVKENSRLSLQGIFYFNTPKEEVKELYLFVPFSAEDQKYNPAEELIFSVKLKAADEIQSEDFQKYSLLVNLFIKDSDGQPTNISENIYFE